MTTDEKVLASVKRGKPPADCAVIGTWSLRSYVRERLSDGQRHNQFGEAPVGYIGYAPDGRMYAIFTRDDRIAPRDAVPTDEEGVQLLGTMVAYCRHVLVGRERRGPPHRHLVEPGLDRNRPNPPLRAGGRRADDHDRALPELSRRHDGSVDPGLEQGAMIMRSVFARGEQ